MWQHQFSQVQEATSKISGAGHCPVNITYLAFRNYCGISERKLSIYGFETLVEIQWSITILSMLFIIYIIGILENKSYLR